MTDARSSTAANDPEINATNLQEYKLKEIRGKVELMLAA
jgi:hypothetical protein